MNVIKLKIKKPFKNLEKQSFNQTKISCPRFTPSQTNSHKDKIEMKPK